jgi:hypothetical protein
MSVRPVAPDLLHSVSPWRSTISSPMAVIIAQTAPPRKAFDSWFSHV